MHRWRAWPLTAEVDAERTLVCSESGQSTFQQSVVDDRSVVASPNMALRMLEVCEEPLKTLLRCIPTVCLNRAAKAQSYKDECNHG